MTSITLTNTGGTAIPLNFYATTISPTLAPQRVTVGQFPAANPNWVRGVTISNEFCFIQAQNTIVAISINDLVALGLQVAQGLTWTPPVMLLQPVAQASANLVPTANYASGTYALSGIVSGQTYYWTKGANDTSLVNGSTTLTSSGSFTATTSTTTLNGTGTSAITATVRPQVAFVANVGSEYTMTPVWQVSTNSGSTWSTVTAGGIYAITNSTTNGILNSTLSVLPTSTTPNGYLYRLQTTDNAGSYGLTNGTVTSYSVALTVT
jgi:hypothetical protein